ncbi:MAG: PKD domain-containing protein, partial [Bacteroidota bacterium]
FPQNSNGVFSYSGPPVGLNDLGNGTASFNPVDAYPGGWVTYTYTDGNGCVNYYTDTVTIYPLPVADFSMGDACISDSIDFFDLTTSIDSIVNWYWQFGDVGSPLNFSFLQNPSHLYYTAGNKTVSLSVTTASGCQDTETKTVTLGSKPLVNFSWSNECFGTSATEFYNTSSDTSNVFWDFGDGDTSVLVNPIHNYTAVSTYYVTLVVQTPNQCVDTMIHQVSVRPYVTSYPYFEDFEIGNGGWIPYEGDTISSWEYGEPDGAVINSAASGTYAWCTNLDDNYVNNEKSTIIGPCFDFTNLQRPMIIMKIWTSTQKNADGAVLQARVDGVTDWMNVGSLGDGINWYNGVGLTGNPGGTQNVGSYGWTGETDTSWVEVRHELDNLKGMDNVRFRIAFGSDGNGSSDGFAFDDIWVGERSRMVLVEHFTNSADVSCANINPGINNIVQSNPGDVVDIQYHTSNPGFDQMNNDNPASPGARALYYGTSSVPWSIVDGNVFNNFSLTLVNNPDIVELRALEDPYFRIDLETSKTSTSISVDADIIALRTLTGKNLTFHAVVVEKEITSLTGSNGETSFRSVMKKMLPDAGGTNYSQSWSYNQSETVTQSWTFENVYNPDQIYVVAFIQDEDTKEIYQAITDDTSIVFTSIGEPVYFTEEQRCFIVYPNPASEMVNIMFSSSENARRYIEVYDNIGQLVETIIVNPGTRYIRKDINQYSEGLYLFILRDENKMIEVNKLIIAY